MLDAKILDAFLGVEAGVDDAVRGLCVAGEIVRLHCAKEVGVDFWAGCVEGGPIWVGLEWDFVGVSEYRNM